jgi:hypothetical protein
VPTTNPAAQVAEPPSPQAPLALDVLALVVVEREGGDGYQRDAWYTDLDLDGDGCRTRAEVLIEESLSLPQVDISGCGVVEGDWVSRYDGVATSNPGDFHVDHVVALKEAFDSGGWAWPAERRAAFANDLTDPRTLIAVTAQSNQDKGDKDPSNWLPADPTDRCRFLGDWIAIKARWRLSMDPSEAGRIRNVIEDECPDLRIDPLPPLPQDSLTAPFVNPITPGDDSGSCHPSYPDVCIPPPPPDLDCADIPYRRFRVLPPDPHNFDGRDDDGIGCESG